MFLSSLSLLGGWRFFCFRFGNCIALHVQAGMEYRNEWETGPKEWIPREFEREFEKSGFFFRSSFDLLSLSSCLVNDLPCHVVHKEFRVRYVCSIR